MSIIWHHISTFQDRSVSDHALTTLTYRGIEAMDPYITTQMNGTHTIARRMSNKIEI
jgi:hypothetical protein